LEYLLIPFEFNCYLVCVNIDSATVYSPTGSNCTFIASSINAPVVSSIKVLAAPNPFHERIHLSWGLTARKAEIAIYNSIGNLVYSKQVEQTEHCELNLENLASGIYAAVITLDGTTSTTVKIIAGK
jgi:hypothetical protein